MKVAIDARMLKMSGIGTYIQNMMKRDCYTIALGNKEDLADYSEHVESIIEFNSKIYGVKEQFYFPYKELKKVKPDILHVPHYNIPIFYRGKMIVTIHDLTHLVLPEFLPNKISKWYARFMIWIALKKASKVLVVSENTKNDILRMFKVNPSKIEVIYNGVGDEFVPKEKKEIEYLYEQYSIPKNKKLLMYVGNLKPHKNLARLLEAFSKLNHVDQYRLILVGKSFTNQMNLVDLEKDLKISDYVIHTGVVEQDELVDLYNLVNLFVFPSLYEGFGLPILEALSCGTNVISSNTSSMPEVGGNYIDYFDPYDIETIKKSIEKNIENRIDSRKIKNQLDKFSWNESVKKFKKIVRR